MTNEENHSVPPTDDQIVQAFRDYVAERADAGNHWARSVTQVEFVSGKVTITLDPERAGDKHWALLADDMQNPVESFTSRVAFHDDTSKWLRQRVDSLEVRDVDGRNLGEANAAELAAINKFD